MTIPVLIASGQGGARCFNDDVYNKVFYEGVKGLFDPAVVAMGALHETRDGTTEVYPGPNQYVPRQFEIEGAFIGGTGRAELQSRSHDFFETIQGTPSLFEIGSLQMPVMWGQPRGQRFTDHDTHYGFVIDGRAAWPTWESKYAYAVGGDQGILVRDDRLDRTDLKATAVNTAGTVISITNPGTAPTYAQLMISCTGGAFTAGYVVYLRNVDPRVKRRVPVTMTYSGSTGIAAAAVMASKRVLLMPGVNILRIETSTSGTLDTAGTYVVGLAGTTTRFLGNSGDKMTEGPVFSHYRRGVASYSATAAGIFASAGDMQPRIGVPYGDATVAGLVLEQATTNLLSSNQATAGDTLNSTAGFDGAPADGRVAGTTPLSVHASVFHQGAKSITGSTPGLAVNEGMELTGISGAAANTAHTLQFWWLATTGSQWQVYLIDTTNGINGTPTEFVGTGAWQHVKVTNTTGAGAANLLPVIRTTVQVAANFYFDEALLAPLPFSSSWFDATRHADMCALYRPHSYLKYSRDLTQIATTGSNWVKSHSAISVARNQTAADGTASSNRITWNAVNDYIHQDGALDCRPNSTPWTLVVAMRLGSLSGANTVALRIEDQSGNLIGSATSIAVTDLSASETRTFFVTVTAAQVGSDDTGVRGVIKITNGTNSPDIEIAGLLKGSFPGAPAHTEGSAIPLPQYGYDWPDWITQNGYVEFDAVLPPISTGLTYGVAGAANAGVGYGFAIYRYSGDAIDQYKLRIVRRSDDGNTGETDVVVGNIWDGAVHTFKLEWTNYVLSGTQYMYLKLYVDGGLKSTSTNKASATCTEWSTPERLWLSDGSTIATIRDLTFGVPTNLPAGAVPAT